MASIAPLGKYQAFDDNGDPLVGGKLYTYLAGTNTPKATYTTAAGDVENTNPVILDSSGYADVWLGDGGYKFALTDADDSPIFTVDNIGGSSDTAFGGQVNSISSNTSITNVYANSVNIATGSPTLSLLPAEDAGEGFYFSVKNEGSGTVTIDPDGSETIDGVSTKTLAPNTSALVITNGVAWFTLFYYPIYFVTDQTAKTSLVDADQFAIADSAASNANKKITYANVKTQLRTDMPASDTTTGFVEKATQAEMESQTADKYPDAALIKYNPGVAKAWFMMNASSGTPTLVSGMNIASFTDSGAGLYVVNFTTAFSSSTAYTGVGSNSPVYGTRSGVGVGLATGSGQLEVAPTASAFAIETRDVSGNLYDPKYVGMSFYGDQ